jgi:hypothetical protein
VTITSNTKRFQLGTFIITEMKAKTSDVEDVIVPTTPPLVGEPQRGTTIALAIRTPERLQGPPELIPERASSPKVRLKVRYNLRHRLSLQGLDGVLGKSCRVANKLYTDSQYDL